MNTRTLCSRQLSRWIVSSMGALTACSAAEDGGNPSLFTASTAPVSEPAESPAEAMPARAPAQAAPPSGGLLESEAPAAAPEEEPAKPAPCETVRAAGELIRTPIDIIVILDNSGSMGDETSSVEANVNESFARILEENQVDYRMILVSEHRERSRQNAICITQPLSGLGACPAPLPVASERFFQYSVGVGSRNSLQILLETYAGEREDDFRLAPGGWSQWLRPEAQKVFLVFTDDDANLEAEEFIQALGELSPSEFGSVEAPRFVWHSIVGLAEKASMTDPYAPSEGVEEEECHGNDNNVFNAGETYQTLSQLTGGLRFPICQFQAYDTVFQTIASDLVSIGAVQCEYPLPEPPLGQEIALERVLVAYTPGGSAEPTVLTRAPDLAACSADSYLLEPSGVRLCAAACDRIRADSAAELEVSFSCDRPKAPLR